MTIPLNESVTWEPATTLNAYGEASYGTAQSLEVWFVQRQDKVLNQQGAEVTSNSRIHIPGDIAVGFKDRFTLPDGSTPPVIAISKPRTPDEVHRTKVFF
jgi:hypothetical protein